MGNKSSTSSKDLAALSKDTKMDRDEVAELMKTFNKLSNKGKITKESIKTAMKKTYGDSYDASFSNLLFNLFDKDGSKEIDAQEFILAVGYLMNRSIEDVVGTSFRCIDLNGDGFVSKGELRSVVMTNFKIKKWVNVHKKAIGWDKVQVTPAEMSEINREADELFAALDVDKDGQVSRDEFVQRANGNAYLKKKLTELLVKDEGQAGLQVGAEFWKLVDKEYQRSHWTFFNQHRGDKARCILVDSEPKVCVQEVIGAVSDACKGVFLQDNIIFDQPGRGNNWAFGYNDKRTNSFGETLADRAMNEVAQEVKHRDGSPSLFVIIHSLAGGTGSDFIASVCIAPYAGGEVVLQSFNCLLSLAELTRKADFVILLSNEISLKMLEKVRKPTASKGGNSVSVHEINLYFAKCLAGLFFPTNPGPVDHTLMKTCLLMKYAHTWDNERLFDPGQFVKTMCPNQLSKFIELRQSPCSFDGRDVIDKKWGDIATEVAAITPRYMHKNLVKTVSSQMVVRGDKAKSFMQEYTSRGVRDKLLKSFVKADDFTPDIRISLLPTMASANYQQSITLCTNRDSILEFLVKILEDANAKFTARAYVHWYHRYGCSDDVFEEAFHTMRRVLSFYQDLSK